MATTKELWSIAGNLVGEEELNRRYRQWITGLIRAAKAKAASISLTDTCDSEVAQIIDDLNARTGSRFQIVPATKALILHLMKSGYVVEDFLHVHEIKCLRWLNDESMRDYLRPSTLYRPSHFDEYLAEWYGMKRQAAEKEHRRSQTQTPPPNLIAQAAERKAKHAQLMATPWHTHATWSDFVRHTMTAPDPESLCSYLSTCPQRIEQMYRVPNMRMNVLKNKSPDWANDEYVKIAEANK